MKIFSEPQMMTRYKDQSYRFVSNKKIQIGDIVECREVGRGEIFRKTVTEILEERPSLGNFDKDDRPFSYKLIAE